MFKKLAMISLSAALFTGCAAVVPMAEPDSSDAAKQFSAPAEGQAGLYIYREHGFADELKKDLWVDGECLGESAQQVFFYTTVEGGKEHTIATESEMQDNQLVLMTESGKNYFVRQYIKLGIVVEGANLEQVDEETGQQAVSQLELAQAGTCSK